ALGGRAEALGPDAGAGHVILRRPVLEEVARLLRRSAGKTPPFDVDEVAPASPAGHDEVQTLERHRLPPTPPRLVHGQTADPPLAEEIGKGCFIMVAAVHGKPGVR